MKIQGHLHDYPLATLLEVLIDRRESGCLSILFQPEPAVLHFKSGRLIDARLSRLRGPAVIHRALAMEQVPFEFDNEILIPDTAIDTYEREISRVPERQLTAERNGNHEKISLVKEHELEARPGTKAFQFEVAAPALAQIAAPPALTNQALATFSDRGPESSETVNPLSKLRPVFTYLRQPNLMRATIVIFLVAVPAAIGITARFGRKAVGTPASAAAGQVTSAPAVHPSDPQANRSEINVPASKPLPTDPVQTMPSNSLENPKNQVPANDAQTIKTVGEPQASRVISNITKVNEEARPVSESAKSPSSGPVSRQGQTTKTIVVEVSIEQGRVTKAWVKNSRKGLEAFEAAALRIIRLRRYSKGSTGTDSVSLDVTVNQ